MGKSKVIVRDLGFVTIMKELQASENTHVVVGVQGKEGSTAVKVASVHEFGSLDDGDPIPERSFIRLTIDLRRKDIGDVIEKGMGQVADGKRTTKDAAEIVGLFAANAIKRTITRGDPTWPELLESTIKAKGSSKPLIDTGFLRSSITHQVVVGKKPPKGAI